MAPTWYQDAETGEYFQADDLDQSQFEIVGQPQVFGAPEEYQPKYEFPDWLSSLGGIPGRALSSAASGGAGALEMLGDAFGGITGYEGISDFGKDIRQRADDLAYQVREDNQIEPGSGWDVAQGVAGDLVANAPVLGAGLLKQGGKWALGAGMSALPSLTKYGTLKEQGVSPGEAALGAAETFGLNTLLNRADVGRFMTPRAGSAMKDYLLKAAGIYGTDAVTNAAGTFGDAVIDAQVGVPQTKSQFYNNMQNSLLGSLGTSTAFTGINMALPRPKGIGDRVEAIMESQALADGPAFSELPPRSILPDRSIVPQRLLDRAGVTTFAESMGADGPSTGTVFKDIKFPEAEQPSVDQPLIQPAEDFSPGRTTREQNQLGPIAEQARQESAALRQSRILNPRSDYNIEITQQLIDSSNRSQRAQPEVSPIIKVEAEKSSFDDPIKQARDSALKAEQEAPPTIVTEENAPFTFKDVWESVKRNISGGERGSVDPELLGLGLVGKIRERVRQTKERAAGKMYGEDVVAGTKIDPRYERFNSSFRNNITYLDTIGKQVPEVKPLTDAIDRKGEDQSRMLFNAQDQLNAMFKVRGDEGFNSAVWKAEELGSSYKHSPENLAALGLNQDQISGVMASKALQEASAKELRDHKIDMAQRQAALDIKELQRKSKGAVAPTAIQKIQEGLAKQVAAINSVYEVWMGTNYVPRNRYGRFKIKVFKDGQLFDDRQTDSKRELAQWNKAYKAQGFDTKIDVLVPRVGKGARPPKVSVDVENMAQMFESGNPITSFPKHLMKSRRIKGADTDVARAWADYKRGQADYIATERMNMAFKEAEFDLPRDPTNPSLIDNNLTPVVTEIKRRFDAMSDQRSPWWGRIGKAADLTNLTFQLRSPLGNVTAIFTRQYPELGKYIKNPAATISKSFKVNLDRMKMSDEAFGQRYPDLARGVAEAQSKGIISSNFAKKVGRVADNKNKAISTFDDVAFFFQFHGDRFADANGFITGWLAYPDAVKSFEKSNKPVPSRQAFAEQFAKDTKANVKTELLPVVQQGMGQSTFVKYKSWQFRYLSALKEAVGKDDWAFIARSLGASLAVGGARALPFYKTIISAANAMGINPEAALEEYLSDTAASLVLYGPTSVATGINISGAVGFGDPLPDASRGWEAAIGSIVGGPIVSMATKLTNEVPQFIKEGRWDRAVENAPVLPLLKDLAKMYRYGEEGVITKTNANILPKDQVDMPLMLKQLLGFGDLRVARGYDKYMAGRQAEEAAKSDINYNELIAEAMQRGQTERVNNLKREAYQKGFPPNMDSVFEILRRRQGNPEAMMKRIPKKSREAVAKARQRYND